jgi:hypothetical protein
MARFVEPARAKRQHGKNDADNALAQTNASKKMRKVFADSAGLGGRNKQ